ncbi:MAG TPA: hypothetical protein PKK43_06240 [Spirochaetota bacterium]|nr:hypothetical protein [Spirochaetota bacterium]
MTYQGIHHGGTALVVCALKTEAKGIINAYEMERNESVPFPLFMSEGICCAVTGVGAIQVMRVLPLAIGITAPAVLINAGCAGTLSSSMAKDTVYEITRANMHEAGESSPRSIELVTTGAFPGATLFTSPEPVLDAESRGKLGTRYDLVDMEGYAVAAIAEKTSIPVSIIKIVSDSSADDDELTIRRNITRCGETLARETVRFIRSL